MTLLQRYEAMITQSGIQRSRNRPSFTMEGITINNGTMERQFTAALRSIGAEVFFCKN
jgi:IS30 family transposase